MCISRLMRSWPHGLEWKRETNPARTDPKVDVRAWKILEDMSHAGDNLVRTTCMQKVYEAGHWLYTPNLLWLVAEFDAKFKRAPATYPCGFHAYLNLGDAMAIAMPHDLVLEVRMRDIVALGYEYSTAWARPSKSSTFDAKVIVARSMFIVPKVKPFVLQ